ncbi:hypothetical protein ES705_05955 [subsurface metagenome]|jgi:hypothetical protein
MKTVVNTCCKFEQLLHDASNECCSFSLELKKFNQCTSESAKQLKLVLMGIVNEIKRLEKSLYLQHDGIGYVFLFMGINGGMTMHWVGRKGIVADKYRLRNEGLTVVSISEVLNTIAGLLENLDLGNLAEAITWINNYRTQPLL